MLFKTELSKHTLSFIKLSQCPDKHIPLAAKWAEDEWGYIRNMGVAFREGVMRSMSDKVYIGMLSDQPIAMFALAEHSFHEDLINGSNKLPKTFELMYVYVEKDYRGLGFGKQIIKTAKTIATGLGADLILLDTLKPSLNRLYEKHGAKILGEGRLFSHPTDVLTIKI